MNGDVSFGSQALTSPQRVQGVRVLAKLTAHARRAIAMKRCRGLAPRPTRGKTILRRWTHDSRVRWGWPYDGRGIRVGSEVIHATVANPCGLGPQRLRIVFRTGPRAPAVSVRAAARWPHRASPRQRSIAPRHPSPRTYPEAVLQLRVSRCSESHRAGQSLAACRRRRGWDHDHLGRRSNRIHRRVTQAVQDPGAMRPARCVSSKTALQAWRAASAFFRHCRAVYL